MNTNPDSFYVVGIGASAGGLEAFEQFFSNMPPDSGMAFILVPHLSPEHKSMMVDLLARFTGMKIFEAVDGMPVRPDCVYIIPPDRDIAIIHSTLSVLEPAERRGLRHPIDFFFRSLAADQGEKAIAVILSGTGTEGALGLKNIKGEGGLVLAQDVSTARYDGMPSSAIATGLVDYILPADKMPEQLLRFVKSYAVRPLRLPAVKEEGKPPDMLRKIFLLIRAQTGHDFSQYKHNTVLRRIERRMSVLQIVNLRDYVTFLRGNPHEIEVLFRELLIRVTSFFRDPQVFSALAEKALPELFACRADSRLLRVWVPGCSTGEEAYSLAIILHEYMLERRENYKVQIFATDIDNGAIEKARAGVYPSNISVDVSPERLSHYFIQRENTFRVKDEIREMVVFAVQNLVKDPPFSKLDLISCRNVLIYLGSELQKKVLPLFRYALSPDGVLVLGSSETIGDTNDLFSCLDKKWKIFRARRDQTIPVAPIDIRVTGPAGKHAAGGIPQEAKRKGITGVGDLAENLLLDHYSPSCAIVDGKGEILYLHGRTGKYLEPASGRASLSIIEMSREGLRFELRSALRRALKQKDDVSLRGLRVKTNGNFQAIDLEVRYIRKPEHLEGLLMVVFKETEATHDVKTKDMPALPTNEMQQHIDELEFELKSAREHLQTTVEELETSNEELQAANEELQSSNEELQSTNEEMETSKEELQSTNEELMTLNAELQHKMDELAQVNDDMNNLLSSTQIATVFLDGTLRIKRFTPSITEVINLIHTDTGRPLSDIVSKLDYPKLVKDAEEVLRTLLPKEKTAGRPDGRWYLTRITPYRTTLNVIEGVVITFVEITDQKKLQETQSALAYAAGIVDTVREPLIVLDAGLRVMSANRAFYDLFGVLKNETEGKLIYELGNRQWDIPALRKLLEEILSRNAQFQDFPVELDFPGIGFKRMLLNARRIHLNGEETGTILLAIEDIQGKN